MHWIFKGVKMENNERNSFTHDKSNKDTEKDLFEFKLHELPKEFHKTLSECIDKRFIFILITSLILHIALAVYFINNPPSKESTISRIAKIQERIAKALMEREAQLKSQMAKFEFFEREPVEEEKAEKREEIKVAKASGKKATTSKTNPGRGDNMVRRRRGGGGYRGKSQEEIAAAIGSKGILALLTSTSSVATGQGVEDILFRSGETEQDLDKVLSNISGIKTGGHPIQGKGTGGGGGGNVKGGRAQGGGGIDDLVSGLGNTKLNAFERSGDLVVVSEAPLIEEGGPKGIVGRNQDEVQAVVIKHNKAIQYCYERALKRNPNLKGKLVLRITITPQGTVKDVKIVSSTLNNRKVEQCVLNRIRRWTDFGSVDPLIGNMTIRQTYAFGY